MKEYFLKARITTFLIFLLSASMPFITISGEPKPNTHTYVKDINTDTLPNVFNENQGRLIESKLRQEAVLKFALHEVPTTKKELETLRVGLKNEIINDRRNRFLS